MTYLRSFNSDDKCCYCFDTMTGGDIVGHQPLNSEIAHCFHRPCILEHAKKVKELFCPFCRDKIDLTFRDEIDLTLTFKDRCIAELKFVAKDALYGAIVAGATGLAIPVVMELTQLAGVAGGFVLVAGIAGNVENRATLIAAGSTAALASVTVSLAVTSGAEALASISKDLIPLVGSSIVLGAIGRGIIGRRINW